MVELNQQIVIWAIPVLIGGPLVVYQAYDGYLWWKNQPEADDSSVTDCDPTVSLDPARGHPCVLNQFLCLVRGFIRPSSCKALKRPTPPHRG